MNLIEERPGLKLHLILLINDQRALGQLSNMVTLV